MSIIETRLNVYFLFLPLFLCLFSLSLFVDYRKITKISPGGYIFQRPFLRGIFLEGLMYGGKFTLCFTLYSRENSKYKPPPGTYISGDLKGFCVTIFGGLYLEGLIFGILR